MRQDINEALAIIFKGIDRLQKAFPGRLFTIDGRLVGDIGEVIAALEYDVELYEVQEPDHDASTPNGRRVQIKATFKNSLTFRRLPEYYLGFKLFPDGQYEEIYNGPGQIILDRYRARKRIGVDLLSFPIAELRRLSALVPSAERISKRKRTTSPPVDAYTLRPA
jgi:hypothetical protein